VLQLTRYVVRCAWIVALVAIGVWAAPGTTPAAVTPVTLIDRQVIKPNMLLLLDVSTSMISAPGHGDIDSAEVGMDCQYGDDKCRMVGQAYRCYYAATGAMGAGVTNDDTQCHNHAECQRGYCKNNKPTSCDGDYRDDGTRSCSGTYRCRGFRSNAPATACTGDGSGYACIGICENHWSKPTCTTDADCPGSYCSTYANDFCVRPDLNSIAVHKSKMCKIGQNRCFDNTHCSAPGDTCEEKNTISRLMAAKRVLSGVVSGYHKTVNFGMMAFYQEGYYTYYPVGTDNTDRVVTRWLDRDELKAANCWSKNGGPTPTCTLNDQNYNRRANPDSRYRVKTGGDNFVMVETNWCGLWCTLPQGTGYYQGSFYTYTDWQKVPNTASPRVELTYRGKTFTDGGIEYVHWDAPTSIRNKDGVQGRNDGPHPTVSGNALPATTDSCNTCNGGKCGVRQWDNFVPFMDTTNSTTKSTEMALAVLARMDKASFGGYSPQGVTPTGCSLWNDTASANWDNNAFDYMAKVKTTDTMPCRHNYILMVTDGFPNTSNDTGCDLDACAGADLSSCTCLAVKAAKKLYDAGIKVYMVGFSQGVSSLTAQKTLNNIARAGGSGNAFFAVQEQELEAAIVTAIYDAARGSYSTAPATSSSGVQKASTIELGKMLIDTRVDFPGWRGNLIAYDGMASPPAVLWNAATVAFDYNVETGRYFTTTSPVDRTGDWKKRNVWTSNGNTMVKITVDQTTGAITNKTTLKTLGLGASDDEAEKVARWMLGDPNLKNPAVLGGLINSSPIDIGPPGKSLLPGGEAFYNAHASRPYVTYAGSSDGMLHAFFTKDVTVGAVNYKAGQEAFAYMPQTMLPVQLKLFAQGGQLPDPKDHIYGLANSPKVKNFCTANCTNASTAVWKTHLVMTYGWGGTEAFMLDITNPFTSSGVKTATAPAPLLWSTQYLNSSTTSAYDNELGLTTSVPAFYYAKGTTKDDFRVVFGSYTTEPVSGNIAKVLLNSSARNGAVVHDPKINPPNSCSQLFGLMSDVASARNHAVNEEVQIQAAYFGDTWGNLYRYVPGVSGASNYTDDEGTVSVVESMTCNHPVHYAPTVIQLDRENASNHPNEIYLIQVTNSALDLVTKDFPPSQMVFRKDVASSPGVVASDTSFGSGGKITLTAGVTSQMCGVTSSDGGTCLEVLPAGARPNATPTAVVRGDGNGFVAIATWYLPAADGCNEGMTYLTVHELNASSGTVSQKFGMKLASEPVTSTVFVGGKLLFAAQDGVTDLTTMLPPNLRFSTTVSGERYRRTGWSELP
jgi:hypothetical protein